MDRKYLEWHGNQYRVQVKVPEPLRGIVGCSRLVVPLHTDSLANANRLKLRIVADLKDRIALAERALAAKSRGEGDKLVAEAFAWKSDIQKEVLSAPVDEEGRSYEVMPDLLLDRARELEKSVGRDRASAFYKTALGIATPITALIDSWLAERPDIKPRQQHDYRRAVVKLSTWLREAGLSSSLEEFSRKLAGRYVSEAMVARAVHATTANKDISALSGYWKWLFKKGYVTENVWSLQSLKKPKYRGEDKEPKRPFTDEEVSILVHDIHSELMLDAVLIAALSGMRTGEIAGLKVADCVGGNFRVRDAKTDAGNRTVPIHSDLRAVIARRTEGKSEHEYLLHELTEPKPGSASERGQGITKPFVRIRRRLGVDEVLPGRRQSRIDFHSFRRWFVATARAALQRGAAGFDQWTIADVVGHDRESLPEGLSMTMGRYAGASSYQSKEACVSSVRLPRQRPAIAASSDAPMVFTTDDLAQ